MDSYDLRLLDALQKDGALTNAALAEIVHLSPSQCSRRRAALEADGTIRGYRAVLNAEKLGITLHAFVRVNLKGHGGSSHTDMTHWLERQPEIQTAFSVSGDADYILSVRTKDLEAFSSFLLDRLVVHPEVGQVRSEFVLKALKDSDRLDIG